MKVAPEELAEFQRRFSQMPHKCPICGCEKFGFNEIESQILAYDRVGDNLVLDGNIEHIPTITTFCLHCGHLDHFVIPVMMNPPVK